MPFATAAERLPAVADMGFDVVYLPPIHPIGTVNRKGPNTAQFPGGNPHEIAPDDVGSPWAIGNVEGGHEAIPPDLGDFDAFDRFVAALHEHGLGLVRRELPDLGAAEVLILAAATGTIDVTARGAHSSPQFIAPSASAAV